MLSCMAILAYGLNHRTAAVDIRERLAFAAEGSAQALESLCARTGAAEAVILSTCNRTEVYCAADELQADAVAGWLAALRGIDERILQRCCYSHSDQGAVGHGMRVAAGLDSQVLGEPQIAGQFKAAFEIAREHGHVGAELGLLGRMSLSTAKRVRNETGIGRNPVSVAYAAVTLAGRVFPDLADAPALLIGAGENIDLLASHLLKAGVRRIDVANRTLARAEALAARLPGEAFALDELDQRLARYDLVISSTGSPDTVLGKDAVQRALEQRGHRPLFMVDIAVPRDIEPDVGALHAVQLYSIDALTEIIDENLAGRRTEAAKAEEIVRLGVAEFEKHRRLYNSRALLQAFRQHGEKARSAALTVAQKRLDAGGEPAQVIERLAWDLANKLMHKPTVAIREASAQGDEAMIAAVRRLYEADDD